MARQMRLVDDSVRGGRSTQRPIEVTSPGVIPRMRSELEIPAAERLSFNSGNPNRRRHDRPGCQPNCMALFSQHRVVEPFAKGSV